MSDHILLSPLEVSCNCAVAESGQGDGTMHGMEVPTFVHMSNIFCALALSAALLVVQQHPIFLSFHLYLTNTLHASFTMKRYLRSYTHVGLWGPSQ